MKRKPAAFRGFTLIELLIVVAIIAILAAIAVPNFLEAQVRSKVSRVKADLRTLMTALESYRLDYNGYITGNSFGLAGSRPSHGVDDPRVLERLSTPIAYLTTAFFTDPFTAAKHSAGVIGGTPPLTAAMANLSTWEDTVALLSGPDAHLYRTYHYNSFAPAQGLAIAGYVTGIMQTDEAAPYKSEGYILNSSNPMGACIDAREVLVGWNKADATALIYDPSNGTTSFGQIWRAGGSTTLRDNLIGAAELSNK